MASMFLDYNSQIQNLKSKNLIVNDEIYAKDILQRTSYYGLINGYKTAFIDPTTNRYISGTTFDDIYQIYLFDTALREIFLKYILIFERHIKSSISYHFSQLHGSEIADYQNLANYDYGNQKNQVLKLFHKMNQKINNPHISPQIKHYLSLYQDVPLWVLMTDLTFGEIATMFRYLKGTCKTDVCNDFHQIGRAELSKMLILLTKARNICAHGNRLFNYSTGDAILDCSAHQKLKIIKKGSLYVYGKSDLFAVVISLKYLLDPHIFRNFYYELKKSIKKYHPSNTILEEMGFPSNWMSILRIKVY